MPSICDEVIDRDPPRRVGWRELRDKTFPLKVGTRHPRNIGRTSQPDRVQKAKMKLHCPQEWVKNE